MSKARLYALALIMLGVGCSQPHADPADQVLITPDTGVGENPDIAGIYDPVEAGEDVPRGFRQVLERDDIFPVYAPAFTSADGVDWAGENLVIGVVIEEEPRAYPVGFLRRREIVVDNHRGIPTLVTW